MCKLRKTISLTDCRVGFSLPIPAESSILHSKFLLLLCTCAFVLFNIALPAHAKYGGGSGEPNDPYLILDPNQMNTIGAHPNDWDKHFELMDDIDLAAFTGTSFNMIGYYIDYYNKKPFSGIFDGNDHTIANFTYESNDSNYIGLFANLTGEIKNLGLLYPDVNAGAGSYVGSLVGYSYSGTVVNCYTKGGSVSGSSRIGGLVGYNYGMIHNSFADSCVSGTGEYAGGLAGYNYIAVKTGMTGYTRKIFVDFNNTAIIDITRIILMIHL